NGVLREVKVQTGTVVTAGQLLALVEEGAQAQAAAAAAKAAPPAEELKATGTDAGKEKLSPSVRRLIEENRLDAAAIPASGRDGRLTKSDVVDFLGRKSSSSPAAAAASGPDTAPAAAPAARAPAPTAPLLPASARGEHRVPMTRLRQRIAQRLVEAQSTQALLTSFNEVDLTAVQELR